MPRRIPLRWDLPETRPTYTQLQRETRDNAEERVSEMPRRRPRRGDFHRVVRRSDSWNEWQFNLIRDQIIEERRESDQRMIQSVPQNDSQMELLGTDESISFRIPSPPPSVVVPYALVLRREPPGVEYEYAIEIEDEKKKKKWSCVVQ